MLARVSRVSTATRSHQASVRLQKCLQNEKEGCNRYSMRAFCELTRQIGAQIFLMHDSNWRPSTYIKTKANEETMLSPQAQDYKMCDCRQVVSPPQTSVPSSVQDNGISEGLAALHDFPGLLPLSPITSSLFCDGQSCLKPLSAPLFAKVNRERTG